MYGMQKYLPIARYNQNHSKNRYLLLHFNMIIKHFEILVVHHFFFHINEYK